MTKKPDPDVLTDQDAEEILHGMEVMLRAFQAGADPTEALAAGLRANGRQVDIIDVPVPPKP